jgi:hypothetical protein
MIVLISYQEEEEEAAANHYKLIYNDGIKRCVEHTYLSWASVLFIVLLNSSISLRQNC